MVTLEQALGWIRGGWQQSRYAKVRYLPQVGRDMLGIDVDGLFGFQCKDWANAYAEFVGRPFTGGNAIVLWTRVQPGWAQVQECKPGYVFVKNYVASDGINYGHTGVVDEVVATGFYSYDQNVGQYSSLSNGFPPQRVFHKFNEMLGYLKADSIKEDNMRVPIPPNIVREHYINYIGYDPGPNSPALQGRFEDIVDDEFWYGLAGHANNTRKGLVAQVDALNKNVTEQTAKNNELMRTNQTLATENEELKKQIADGNADSIVITKKGWAALWTALKSFFDKNN